MTIDRKRLRELAPVAWYRPDTGEVRLVPERPDNDPIWRPLFDALEAAEQRALPMDDARDAARFVC